MRRSTLYIKMLAMIVIAIMILNVVLFSFRKIDVLVFWIVIIVSALIAYKGIPLIKRRI